MKLKSIRYPFNAIPSGIQYHSKIVGMILCFFGLQINLSGQQIYKKCIQKQLNKTILRCFSDDYHFEIVGYIIASKELNTTYKQQNNKIENLEKIKILLKWLKAL